MSKFIILTTKTGNNALCVRPKDIIRILQKSDSTEIKTKERNWYVTNSVPEILKLLENEKS